MENAVIEGTFADLKTVKTRSTVQMIIELPIERGEEVIRKMGFPQPGKEINVAVARLMPVQESPKSTEKQKSKAQEAGILCGDTRFQSWMGTDNKDMAATLVRNRLNITSRSELNTNSETAAAWDALVVQYKQDTGQMAEG